MVKCDSCVSAVFLASTVSHWSITNSVDAIPIFTYVCSSASRLTFIAVVICYCCLFILSCTWSILIIEILLYLRHCQLQVLLTNSVFLFFSVWIIGKKTFFVQMYHISMCMDHQLTLNLSPLGEMSIPGQTTWIRLMLWHLVREINIYELMVMDETMLIIWGCCPGRYCDWHWSNHFCFLKSSSLFFLICNIFHF